MASVVSRMIGVVIGHLIFTRLVGRRTSVVMRTEWVFHYFLGVVQRAFASSISGSSVMRSWSVQFVS